MSPRQLQLKWSDFEENVVSSFQGLRKLEDFADVTLVSGDQKIINAHKIVLSCGSGFFRTFLSNVKNPHPLIFLRGVDAKNLAVLVDFIYYGEVNMPEDDVEDFLSLATDLQVKGLAMPEEEKPKGENEQKKLKKVEGKHRKRTPIQKSETLENSESKEKVKIEIEPQTLGETSQQDVFRSEPIISKFTEDGKVKVNLKERNAVLEKTIDSMLKSEGGLWGCSACGKTGANKWVLRNHIETHIEGFVHMCPQCEKKFRTSNALQFHVFTLHKKCSSSEQKF